MAQMFFKYLESGMAKALWAPPVVAPFVLPSAFTPPGCRAAHTVQERGPQRKSTIELLLRIAHLTFMRCMMVHSVSTKEVGSLPPSLSNVCEQDSVYTCVVSCHRTLLWLHYSGPLSAPHTGIVSHLLKLLDNLYLSCSLKQRIVSW